MYAVWSLNTINPVIQLSPWTSIITFFTPEIVKYTEKNLDITNVINYGKFILLLIWPLAFVILRFHHPFQRSMPISCYLKSGDSLFWSMATPHININLPYVPVWWCLQLALFLTSSELVYAHKLIPYKSSRSYQWHLFFNIFKYTFLVETLFNYM